MKNKNRYTDVMDVGFNDDIMERETQSDVMVAPEPFLVVKNRGGRPTLYRPEYCEHLVDWFQAGLEEITNPERVTNKIGDIKHVTAPIFPRTIAGYACIVGVGADCLTDWASKHAEFGRAMKTAKAIQEQCAAMMTATGAWTPSFGIFMLKNCSGWTDRVDITLDSQVTLTFDAADSEV
jgi:hypothetical protein|tara:strand:- start:27 stop:563 length:537 start_codon:yes stop_codon:yes gene_type:complete